jgi:hypothetical protein
VSEEERPLDLDVVLPSRSQFAFVVTFHIIFHRDRGRLADSATRPLILFAGSDPPDDRSLFEIEPPTYPGNWVAGG